MFVLSSGAQASIVSAVGGVSTGPGGGAGPAIIAAPADATQNGVTNMGQQGFDERQGVLLLNDLEVDGGFISAGTRVDSHMIFFNTLGRVGSTHLDVLWEFSGKILGVMSNPRGTIEIASTPILGLAGTLYPDAPFNTRGMDYNTIDGYQIVSPFELSVDMRVTDPGDWIRVVTATPVPVPAAGLLFMTALAGFGLVARRRRRAD